MKGTLDLDRPVSELCQAHPELIGILNELGFTDITKPGMLATAGRFMTLPKGAALKGLAMETIKQAFRKHGYTIKEDAK